MRNDCRKRTCTYEDGDFFWFMHGPELPSNSSNIFSLSYLKRKKEEKERKKKRKREKKSKEVKKRKRNHWKKLPTIKFWYYLRYLE